MNFFLDFIISKNVNIILIIVIIGTIIKYYTLCYNIQHSSFTLKKMFQFRKWKTKWAKSSQGNTFKCLRPADQKICHSVSCPTTFMIRILLKTITVCRPRFSCRNISVCGHTSRNQGVLRRIVGIVKFYCRCAGSILLLSAAFSVTFISVYKILFFSRHLLRYHFTKYILW